MVGVMDLEQDIYPMRAPIVSLIANRCALEAVNMCRMRPQVLKKAIAGVVQIAAMGETL